MSTFFVYLFASGGHGGTGLLFMLLIPLAAPLFLGWKSGVAVSLTGLTACAMVAVWGSVTSPFPGIPEGTLLARLAAIYLVSLFLSSLYDSGMQKAYAEEARAREALHESEERYRTILDETGDGYFELDLAGNLAFANDAMLRLLGCSWEEATGLSYKVFAPTEGEARTGFEDFNRMYKTGEPLLGYPSRIVRRDGSYGFGETSAFLIRNAAGEITGFRGVRRDITERKEAEEALRRSEERYRTILEEMDDSYFETDLGGRITFVNNSTCRNLGYSQDELIGMSYKGFTAEEDIESVFRIFHEVHKEGTLNRGFSWKMVRKDGSHGFAETSVSPLRDDNGEIIGFRGVGRDVTERRRMQEQLTLTDRLASIGQLTSGIAHELNNPLTGIIGFSDLLLRRELPADIMEDLEIVNREAKRTSGVVKGLLAFARQQETEKRPLDINCIIQEVLRLRAYEQRVNNIEVETRFSTDLPEIVGNGAQLQQVFMNIIINAEHAVLGAHGRGRFTIVTERVGDVVRASIADDGPGISAGNMKRLFNPFFTTKEVGKGTGLGLSICHGIVTEHRGSIYAESEPGKGARFVVELPVVGSNGGSG